MDGKTNFHMWQIVKLHYEKHKDIERGFVSIREINLITAEFNINHRTILDLRNLRDFVVAAGYRDHMDMTSAIVHIIDGQILNLGGEI